MCYSYSKSFSLPGERIGYIVIPGEVADFNKMFGAIAGAARVECHVNAPSCGSWWWPGVPANLLMWNPSPER